MNMAGFYLLMILINIHFFAPFVSALYCGNASLGMQNGVIPDNKITASSGIAGEQARLNYTNGTSWCALENDTNPYLQIDLGTPHIICAVSTQGNHQGEQWVETFQLSFSNNDKNYLNYSEYGKLTQIFYANLDGSGIVKQILYHGIFARYLRVLPKMHHGAVCMRIEIYGLRIQSENLALNKMAVQSSTAYNGVASRAVDGNRDNKWLGSSCTHCGYNSQKEWWRVDLGTIVQVAEISLFNRFDFGFHLWKYLFELRIGNSTSSPTSNPRCGGEYGIVPAGSITIVCNPTMNGRYVTVRQLRPNQRLSLCEVEVYSLYTKADGNTNAPVCVRLPVGVSNVTVVQDNRLSASTIFNNTRYVDKARLFGNSSWRPRDDDTNPWLQIDLGEIYYVCAVATQGDPNSEQRTRKYKVKWSLDGENWEVVKLTSLEFNGTIFSGNRDSSSIIQHILPIPIATRMIRFYPVEKNKAYALRVELYGTKMVQSTPLQLGDQTLLSKEGSYVDLVCRADRGLSINWYYNDTDITSYSNGTVISRGIIISKLRINYTSADDVYDKYSCGEAILQKINCTSLDYICQVDYGSYRKRQSRGKITLQLVDNNSPTKNETSKKEEEERNGKNEEKDRKEKKDVKHKEFNNSIWMIVAIAAPISVIFIIIIVLIIIRHKRIKARKPQSCEFTLRSQTEAVDQTEQNQQELTSIVIEKYSGPISVDILSDCISRVSKNKYEKLKLEFQELEEGPLFPSTDAQKSTNKSKNRYINIVPYDKWRVVLEKQEEEEDSDYINASYIRGYDGQSVAYISCQGPVIKTIDDFWRMIWQEKTSVIIMLTGLKEGEKIKCQKYWPETKKTYLELSVELRSTEVFADYVIRIFNVSKISTSEQRYVFQYHFTAWPDMGVPDATALLGFRQRIMSDVALVIESPWVVHCSAGSGRTGAFLAIDAMLRQIKETKTIDIFSYVKTMRESRPSMVQTEEQYLFIHTAIHEYLLSGNTEIRAEHLNDKITKLLEIDEKENISGFEIEFKKLLSVCTILEEDKATIGSKNCNIKKNRFKHILPLDGSRVILQVDIKEKEEEEEEEEEEEAKEEEAKEGADYINASYAKGYRQKDAYILTQAPLDNTIADFWKMIYDKRLGAIVMLNNLQEGNVIYTKYWPTEGSRQFGEIEVEIVHEKFEGFLASRIFRLTHQTEISDNVHEVSHFQHIDWIDGYVPKTELSVLDLFKKLQRSQQQSNNATIVVQCSDGVGRSGTLCVILSLLERVKIEQIVDVFQTVKILRKSRPGAVENVAQYIYCFKVIMAYLETLVIKL